MKYSFKNLNKSIDRWIANKTNLAPDKDYTETFLREQYTDLVNNFEGFKHFTKNPHFQTAYHKYRIGDQGYLDKIFSNDDELIESKIFIPSPIKRYKIIDAAIKKELFKKIKEAITILEIKRKLNGIDQPLKGNKKYDEQIQNSLDVISEHNTLDFYFNENNIRNQNLVRETILHIENNRKNIFSPLDFLNLLRKQYYFVLENYNNPIEVKKYLLALPITDEQKHILYFFIVKWFGGVNMQLNYNHKHTLRLIENEFKLYSRNTPEKDIYFLGKPPFEKFTFQEIIESKLKFDKLTYPEKLKYWDENFWSEYGIEIATRGFYLENEIEDENEIITPENSISIYPKDKNETKHYTHWMLNHVQSELHYNFDKQKEKYFKTIKDNPRAVEFTELEIEAIIIQRDKEKKCMQEQKHQITWGYYLGYHSVVSNNYPHLQYDTREVHGFKQIIFSYAKGICDAHYLGFLEAQLEQLRQEKKVLPQHIETKTTGIPENPYPEIFKNGHALNMFLELKKLTVKNNSLVADYSFIFHKMKHKDIKAINQSVTQPVFIQFLNKNQNTDISVVKLPFKNPQYKERVYSTVLDKFKGLV